MEELKDIQGLDNIAMWPLAVGWWLVIGLMVAILLACVIWAYKRYRYIKSWQYKSYNILTAIAIKLNREQMLPTKDLKQLLHELAIEIRRIGMQKYARESCAGLFGAQWLIWLRKNDPTEFDWPRYGQVIVDYQYMPELHGVDKCTVNDLIAAAKKWVEKC